MAVVEDLEQHFPGMSDWMAPKAASVRSPFMTTRDVKVSLFSEIYLMYRRPKHML
jgi:hypothetical protein